MCTKPYMSTNEIYYFVITITIILSLMKIIYYVFWTMTLLTNLSINKNRPQC